MDGLTAKNYFNYYYVHPVSIPVQSNGKKPNSRPPAPANLIFLLSAVYNLPLHERSDVSELIATYQNPSLVWGTNSTDSSLLERQLLQPVAC
jgi:hypothetical protein